MLYSVFLGLYRSSPIVAFIIWPNEDNWNYYSAEYEIRNKIAIVDAQVSNIR